MPDDPPSSQFQTDPELSNSGAIVVISHHVKEGNEQQYEAWLNEIVPRSKTYAGHMGVHIIRPVPGASKKYTAIIRFDTHEHLLTWMHSPDRDALIEKIQPLLADDDRFHVISGMDFWFTPEGAQARLPKRWKQFLVTWSAIFPLVTLTSAAITKFIGYFSLDDNFYIKTFVITGIVVTLMVYVVMPRYTKLVARWLFA
jgi:antibiotic biosynthesis monooxygenase (ABM) superfamily enzyme